MYYIKQTPSDPRLLEMAFDCTNYQAQFPKDQPFETHVFQTIFLNKEDERTWSIKEIAKDKIIRVDWWHQVSVLCLSRQRTDLNYSIALSWVRSLSLCHTVPLPPQLDASAFLLPPQVSSSIRWILDLGQRA